MFSSAVAAAIAADIAVDAVCCKKKKTEEKLTVLFNHIVHSIPVHS